MKGYCLTDIASKIGARCHLKGEDVRVTGLATLEHANAEKLSFLTNPKYRSFLADTKAAAVVITEDLLPICPVSALVLQNPQVGVAKAAILFDNTPKMAPGVHPTAVIHPSVIVPKTAAIGPYVVIEADVHLGEQVTLGAGSVIATGCSIGDKTELKPRVVLYHHVIVGANCLIHSGVVLGSDGFGMANENGRWLKVPQLGSVEVHDDVEIGANTTIDRGAIENTLIGRGVKIDNQVQIAHNVKIGEGTAIAAQVGIAGSTEIGRHCLLGGKVGVNGHIKIGDQVMVTAMSGISSNIDEPGVYSASVPARPVMDWNKTLARLNRLDKLMDRVKTLEKDAVNKQG